MHIHNPLEALRRRLQRSRAESPAVQESDQSHEAIADRTEDLLQRRLATDTRRGPFGEYTYVYDQLASLEGRHDSGELSDGEFEKEKRRILEGPAAGI
jgi:hypothetical protein